MKTLGSISTLFFTVALAAPALAASSHQGKSKSREPSAPAVDGMRLIETATEDASCRALPLSMRQTFYAHFKWMTAGGMSDQEKIGWADRFAKTLGLAMKESSGNPANASDMSLNGSYTSDRKFYRDPNNRGRGESGFLRIGLDTRQSLIDNPAVNVDKQTNYGILQQSADRLDSELNRSVYNFYKRMALSNVKQAYKFCRTELLYRADQQQLLSELADAAKCDAGYPQKAKIKCFAKMVTICPALNLDLALNQPMKYFARRTQKVAPKCTAAFYELAGIKRGVASSNR